MQFAWRPSPFGDIQEAAVSSRDGKIYAAKIGAQVKEELCGDCSGTAIAWSPDGSLLAVASASSAVDIRDFDTKQQISIELSSQVLRPPLSSIYTTQTVVSNDSFCTALRKPASLPFVIPAAHGSLAANFTLGEAASLLAFNTLKRAPQ